MDDIYYTIKREYVIFHTRRSLLVTHRYAGSEIYLEFTWDSVSFNILVDGVKLSLTLTTKCQYYPIPITPDTPHNLTIYVSGPSTSGKKIESSSISGSFELNKIVYVSFPSLLFWATC